MFQDRFRKDTRNGMARGGDRGLVGKFWGTKRSNFQVPDMFRACSKDKKKNIKNTRSSWAALKRTRKAARLHPVRLKNGEERVDYRP